MSASWGFLLCLGVGALGWFLTIQIERNAVHLGLVQHPNHRSSHHVPTPSGGGAAIATSTLLALLILGLSGESQLWPILLATALIAALGLADDLRDLPAALRFPMQALVLGALVWALGPLPDLPLMPTLTLSGMLLALIVLFGGLWWLNLFNFMDGIDGLAGTQAIFILLGACLLWWTGHPEAPETPAFWMALTTSAATAGFLLRNWPPARIFMGDAGSNSLALIIFALALLTLSAGQIGYQAWLILPSVFVSDATLTLVRRMSRGEKPWHAHRRHAYQQLSRRWGHRNVTLLYGALTLLWALPLAWLVQGDGNWLVVALAYAPLVGCAAWANAGGATETSA
ncbi:MraY family glycosyltransferase [Devosia submarina]|uniref:MraY family glycosyltransferase n=1 Tax=Devosia submarina TaxID=1173082 RepID=UPI001300AA0D|nr:glycosyltransferase family 4 protein [Devosia submarina]